MIFYRKGRQFRSVEPAQLNSKHWRKNQKYSREFKNSSLPLYIICFLKPEYFTWISPGFPISDSERKDRIFSVRIERKE